MVIAEEKAFTNVSLRLVRMSKPPRISLGALMDCGSEQRLFALDGIRAVAISMVFFVHLATLFQRTLPHGSAERLVSFLGEAGNSGVDLFFLISAFLIYPRVLRSNFQYLKFIRRRIHRIYPTFFAVFILYLGLSAVYPSESKIHGHTVAGLAYVVENALLLPGILDINPIITVAWSLSYEMFFYLALPLLILTARFRRLPAHFRLAVLLFFSCIVLLWPAVLLGRYRLIMFLFGAVIYELNSLRPGIALSRLGGGLALFSLALGFLTSGLPRKSLPGDYRIAALSYSAFLLLVICSQGAVSRLLCSAPLRRLGNMSYSYYLIHGLVLKLLSVTTYRILTPGSLSAAYFICFSIFAYAATILATMILFLTVERPISLATQPERMPVYFKQQLLPALGQSFWWLRLAQRSSVQGVGL